MQIKLYNILLKIIENIWFLTKKIKKIFCIFSVLLSMCIFGQWIYPLLIWAIAYFQAYRCFYLRPKIWTWSINNALTISQEPTFVTTLSKSAKVPSYHDIVYPVSSYANIVNTNEIQISMQHQVCYYHIWRNLVQHFSTFYNLYKVFSIPRKLKFPMFEMPKEYQMNEPWLMGSLCEHGILAVMMVANCVLQVTFAMGDNTSH